MAFEQHQYQGPTLAAGVRKIRLGYFLLPAELAGSAVSRDSMRGAAAATSGSPV